MKKLTLSVLLMLPILGSCAQKNLKPSVQKKHRSYQVAVPSSDWQQKSFREIDLYFEHKSKKAQIYWSSNCQKVSDSPLVALTAQLLVGFTQIQILKQEPVVLAGREALVSTINAKLDGVPRFLKTVVLRKNKCVFDGIFSASLENKDLEADFDEMYRTLEAEADL